MATPAGTQSVTTGTKRPYRNPVRNRALLARRLDELVETFDIATIAPDPLELVHRYTDPLDQEIAGILAAAFAYGRAELIVDHVGAVLEAMGPSPFAYVAESFSVADAGSRFAFFTHRFHKTPDLVALLDCIASVVRECGSLGALFESAYQSDDPGIGPSLHRFVTAIRSRGDDRWPETIQASLRYLLSSPEGGSACKRMNLYLRWMVRRTEPDLGLWSFVDPAKLVIPLDTHVHRIATFLGLTERRTADWTTATALTASLARFDPTDPVRYDFAICRLGILDRCSRKRKKENCDVCMLRDVCRFPLV